MMVVEGLRGLILVFGHASIYIHALTNQLEPYSSKSHHDFQLESEAPFISVLLDNSSKPPTALHDVRADVSALSTQRRSPTGCESSISSTCATDQNLRALNEEHKQCQNQH